MSLAKALSSLWQSATRVEEGEEFILVKIPLQEGVYRILKTKTPTHGVEYALENPWNDRWYFDTDNSSAYEASVMLMGTVASIGNPEKTRTALKQITENADRRESVEGSTRSM